MSVRSSYFAPSLFAASRDLTEQIGKREDAAPIPERRRGVLSFLTWSFFLATIAGRDSVDAFASSSDHEDGAQATFAGTNA
jgi:hypothetical protein